MADMREKLQELGERRKRLEPGGDEAAIEKQHGRGKLTAWERIEDGGQKKIALFLI